MAQLKIGANRDNETSDSYIYIIQPGQINPLSVFCEKEYACVEVPKSIFIVDENNKLVIGNTDGMLFKHFDTWSEVQEYYLSQQDRFLTPLKIQEFNLNNWKSN